MKKHFRFGLLLSLSLLVCAVCLCISANASISIPYNVYVGTPEYPAKIVATFTSECTCDNCDSWAQYKGKNLTYQIIPNCAGDKNDYSYTYAKKGDKKDITFTISEDGSYSINGKHMLASADGKPVAVLGAVFSAKSFDVIGLTEFQKYTAPFVIRNNFYGKATLCFEQKATHWVYKGTKNKKGKVVYKLYKKTTSNTLKVKGLSKKKRTYFKVIDKVKLGSKTYKSKPALKSVIASKSGFELVTYYYVGKLSKLSGCVALMFGYYDLYEVQNAINPIQTKALSKIVVKRATKKNGKYTTIKTAKVTSKDCEELLFYDTLVKYGKTYYYKVTPYIGKTKGKTTTYKVKIKDNNSNFPSDNR